MAARLEGFNENILPFIHQNHTHTQTHTHTHTHTHTLCGQNGKFATRYTVRIYIDRCALYMNVL
jgi:hypothetical protein